MKRSLSYQCASVFFCAILLSACEPRANDQKPTAAAKNPPATPTKPAQTAQKPQGKSVLDELKEEDFIPQKALTQEEFDKMADEVVAVVGGKEIRRKNVWEVFCVSRDNDQVPPFNQQLLNQAIEKELLYQEGLRRGLDKTDEFKKQLKEAQLNLWKGQVPRLAVLIDQKKLNEFSRTIPPSTPSPEKVEALFAEYRARSPKDTSSDAQVKETIRAMLGKQAMYTAYQKWLADLLDAAKIRVNGKPLAMAKVSQSLRDFSLSDGIKGVKVGQREARMMYDAIRETLPGDTDVTKLTIEVNDDSIKVGDLPELQEIFQQAKTAHKEKLAAPTKEEATEFALKLFTVVKNYVLAQEAKKEGISLAGEGPLWETPLEKQIIASMLIGKVTEEQAPVEPTKEEIIEFYRTHPMYQDMNIESAKKNIYKRLSSEKTRAAAFDRLKERFPVKIIKTE